MTQRTLPTFFAFQLRSPLFWITLGLFGLVFTLELLTPPEYVMGYLYISPILLANPRLNRSTTFGLTVATATLTLLNIWIPGNQPVQAATIANRLITVLALGVTGILCDRNRHIQQALTQQETKLQTQEKLATLREDFTSTLAHDLKTPLLGAIETLKAFHSGQLGSVQPKQKVVLDTIIRSHQTSLQLVETLLDVYRNDAEGLQLHRSTVDLVELAEAVSIALSALATSRRVHLSLHYGDSDFRKFLWVSGDAFQLQRVFTNLLTNAINHSPRGAKVEVALETQSAYQTVRVID